ncbi:MAG: lytic transglycosylase domain-containing protein [Methylococcales bacterium]|nr:lytic transglycosylase domain-containing protein [Methylococcales bacterium]MDP3839702.1 lytic transglycosylase domain-containing protein [Methylococcales bacterium]
MWKLTVISLALLASTEATADVFKFVDGSGHVFYTDQPRNKLYKRIIKTPIHVPSAKNNSGSPFMAAMLKRHTFSGVNKARYSELIADAAQRHQVDEKLLHAVIQTESAYNSTAISSAGATGLMQLMPATALRFGVTDRNDPDQNVEGGTRYLKHLITMFGPRLDLAIAAYNAGENAVIRHNNTIPPYRETQDYVRQVLALYKQ